MPIYLSLYIYSIVIRGFMSVSQRASPKPPHELAEGHSVHTIPWVLHHTLAGAAPLSPCCGAVGRRRGLACASGASKEEVHVVVDSAQRLQRATCASPTPVAKLKPGPWRISQAKGWGRW